MEYQNIKLGKFISRPNRFIAHVDLNGTVEVCHVKNTGRCRELLLPGTDVYVQEFDSGHRKTKYDLISVYKGNRLINMDSQAPNKVFHEWLKCGTLFSSDIVIRPETTYHGSRFDFYVEDNGIRAFIEVKGVTLEENNIAMFPDAPTERGVKHINELCGCLKGKSSLVIFDRHANLKYKYGNRHFWFRGYYVDTVGKNTKKIAEYIRNQIQEDATADQLSLNEYIDPFTGEPVKKGKK